MGRDRFEAEFMPMSFPLLFPPIRSPPSWLLVILPDNPEGESLCILKLLL